MIPTPRSLLLLATFPMLLATAAHAELLRYSGEGLAVARQGSLPELVEPTSDPDFIDPLLGFVMYFEPDSAPLHATSTTATYAGVSGRVVVNGFELPLLEPTLTITRDPAEPTSLTSFSYVFRGETAEGWRLVFDSLSEHPDFVPDLELPTGWDWPDHVDPDPFTNIWLFGPGNAWSAGSDRTLLFDIETTPANWRDVVSLDTWEAWPIGTQDEAFTIVYDVTPGADSIDAVTGLSLGAGDWWTDLAAIVRFAPNGYVDARNGGAYMAVTPQAYQAGITYRVVLSVDFATRTYDATVAPPGGSPITIAYNFAFRSEQHDVAALDTLTLQSMGGSVAVSRVAVDPPTPLLIRSNGNWSSIDLGSQETAFIVTYEAAPEAERLDAVTGLSLGPGDWWTDLAAIVRFAPNGYIDARDGGAYRAEHAFTYARNVTYLVTMAVDLENRTYDATVQAPHGPTVVIAQDYAFRHEQSHVTRLDSLTLQSLDGSFRVGDARVYPAEADVRITSSDTWQNLALPEQEDTFALAYDVTPAAGNVDAVTGLTRGAADWWSDLALTVRFAPSGQVDARDGGSYRAAAPLPYVAGTTYRVALQVDVENRRYSATVTPEGGGPVLIADNYAFRSEHSAATVLDHLALHSMGGATTISRVELD